MGGAQEGKTELYGRLLEFLNVRRGGEAWLTMWRTGLQGGEGVGGVTPHAFFIIQGRSPRRPPQENTNSEGTSTRKERGSRTSVPNYPITQETTTP